LAGSAQLAATLERIDGMGYKAYRDIEGAWSFAEFTLFVDRVQSDPFAAPSKLRVRVELGIADLPDSVRDNHQREVAAASWLARTFRRGIRSAAPRRTGTGKGGLISIDAGGQEVLERTSVVFGETWVEARIEVGLPAAGRRALGRDATRLLVETLPDIITRSWIDRTEADDRNLLHFVDCIENQESIRRELAPRGLVAFVGENAILPRLSGASEEPMQTSHAQPFEVPRAFAIELEVPHPNAGAPGRIWRGMGVPKGITLLVGGGYHGKSTLLRAIERAIVPHLPGDGRETVVSDPGLVKVRAEDGRSMACVDIQAFIDRLPLRPSESESRDTRTFSTPDASGSTSQAANIAEALEVGATGLLLDEDTSATNFMVRDARMQALIRPQDEPITPFIDRVRELYDSFGISTVLVMGGSGDYFEVADTVIEMKSYRPQDATARAKTISANSEAARAGEAMPPMQRPRKRIPLPESFDARRGRRDVKFSTRDLDEIVYGTTEIDLRGVEQLFDPSQTRAVAGAIHLIASRLATGDAALSLILDELDQLFDEQGLDVLDPFHRDGRHPGALARPRRFEIAAALNRMRTLRIRSQD
jgi:predicted ABC-class ATPase